MVETPDPSGETNERAAAAPPGPGERLRRAREAAGLEITRAAAELHLPPATLEALERDDFGSLPATYIQGYLRSYAKRLGLVAEPILEAYRRSCLPEPEPAAAPPPPTPAEVGVGRARRGLYVLLAVLAAVVFLIWWFRAAPPPRGPAPPRPTVTPAPAPASPTIAHSSRATPGSTSIPGSTPAPTPEPAPAQPVAPRPKPTAPAPAAAPPPLPRPAPAPVASGPALVLRCRADSWVEVRDARGRRLVYDLLHAGEVRRVIGTPPFKVLLGNAAAVRIEWDGHPVALPQTQPGKVMRLDIGAAPHP